MRNKLIKIVFIIVSLIFSLLMLSNCVNATVNVGGTTYYTRDDVKWVGSSGYGYIQIVNGPNSGKYYCINHKFILTSHLGHGEDLISVTKGPYTVLETGSNQIGAYIQGMLGGLYKQYNNVRKRALVLYPGNWRPVGANTEEAALYAFATTYYNGAYNQNPSGDVQNAVWQLLQELHSGDPKYQYSFIQTVLHKEAHFYAETWKNQIKAVEENHQNFFNPQSNDAKTRILGKDYIIGPFRITYNTAKFDKVEFTKNFTYNITDQNGSAIPGVQVTNSNGGNIGSIPNGQDFYIRFPYNESIKGVRINTYIQYLNKVEAQYREINTRYQEFKYTFNESDVKVTKVNSVPGAKGTNYNITAVGRITKVGGEVSGQYQNMCQFTGSIGFGNAEAHLAATIEKGNPEMDLAGYVWEDGEQGKDQAINGRLDNGERRLDGIEVRLYNATLGTLAQVKIGTNPTLTDSSGHYEFKGLNPTYKYYVVFTYDGMLYTNTYGAGVPEYNTQAWSISSKGSEVVSERDALNKKFVTISSYPASYKTTPIFSGDYLTNGYNKIFEVNSSTITYYKNRITQQLRNYLASNKRLEDGDSNYINNIYLPIADSVEAKRALQYIWDCRVRAYAGDESERDGKTSRAGGKYYPYYDNFVLTDVNGNRITANNSTTNYQGYRIIYNGQLYINLGIVKRPTTDLQLEEDLYKTVVSINGQDETYSYGTFSKKGVKVNSADAMVTQNIATDDYDYKVDSTNLSSNLTQTASYPVNYAPIQIYATYRINIKNNSSIPTGVNEIATYIDSKYFSYSDSYTTTSGMRIKGIEGTFLYPQGDTEYTERNLTDYNASSFGLKVSTNSKYGVGSQTGTFMGTDLYISFDKNVILEQNQMIAVYITYRLGENSTTNAKFNCTYNSTQAGGTNHAYAILQDLFRNTTDKKVYVYTSAEINAYSTFFKKDFDVGGTQGKYGPYYSYTSDLSRGSTYRAAGLLDALSIPGNLDQAQINKYEKSKQKTEDDWDKASTFVIMDPGGTRNIAGNVWETVDQPANYWTTSGTYPKFDSKYGAQDITVELIEIKNGTEYIRARTVTDANGSYKFTNYIPGLYTIRFIYGDNAKYDTKQCSKYSTFTLNDKQYRCAYNGQFYQSSKSNPKTNDNKYWYAVEEGERYSDAYDEANIRKAINESIQTYRYSDVVSLLKHPTDYMVYAYTSLLDIEVEKATESTSTQKPSYTISNIDFALTPRTESKLSINKEVTHLKLILQNGAVQFDADTATIREQGVPAVVQAVQGSDINISMSSELVNGATLEITYRITVTNDSPEDVVTYYKDSSGNIIALGLYKEDTTKIIYYEDGLIRTYSNNNTFERNSDTTWVSKTTAGLTSMKSLDTNKTQMVETTTRADMVADFVPNNLNFAKTNYTGSVINEGWDLYTGQKADFEKEYYKQKQDDSEKALQPKEVLEMEDEAKDIYDSNAIVLSNNNNALITTNLKHGESVSEDIVLSKVISVNSDSTDTKSYSNKVRIVRINNSVSRVQDMAGAKLVHKSEHVIVSDPTGIGNAYLGIILTLVVATIVGIGIVFIKKYAIKK